MMFLKKRYLIQINYKSGNSIKLWFKNFTVNSNNRGITSVSWDLYSKNKKILHMGVDEIESVFIIKTRGFF